MSAVEGDRLVRGAQIMLSVGSMEDAFHEACLIQLSKLTTEALVVARLHRSSTLTLSKGCNRIDP